MRIFYVNVIEQNTGWGAEWFVNRAFRALGHTTYCVDYRNNRDQLYGCFVNTPECDVFLLQRGDHFPIPLVRSVQVPRFFWATELVSRCRDQDTLLASGLFDHVFLRSEACLDVGVTRGWLERGKCSVMLSGFDDKLHRPIPDTRRNIDVLFVGSLTRRRKDILGQLQSRFNVVIASAFGEELTTLFNRAKVVLNIHAEEFSDTETRVFEALGCGAFLITERLSAENPFSGEELVEFDTVEDLCDKLHYYLDHDDERSKIAHRGHAAALGGHTYIHRAQELVQVMSTYLGTRVDDRTETVRCDWRFHAYGISEQVNRLWHCLSTKPRHYLHKLEAKRRELLRTREVLVDKDSFR